MDKRLYKSSTDQILTGVCGGIAAYFEVDPTIVRVIFFLLSFAQIGVPLYILLAIILPYDYQVEAKKRDPFGPFSRGRSGGEKARRDVTPEDEDAKWDDF